MILSPCLVVWVSAGFWPSLTTVELGGKVEVSRVKVGETEVDITGQTRGSGIDINDQEDLLWICLICFLIFSVVINA